MSLKILYEVTIYRPLDFKNKILINHEMDEIEKIIFQLKQESSLSWVLEKARDLRAMHVETYVTINQ